MEGMNREWGIYIHIPFCLRKCSYCDFYSETAFDEETLNAYVRALLREIDLVEIKEEMDLVSVYIGGGTPSLLKGEHIDLLLRKIKDRCGLKDEAEITIEANPATLDESRICRFYEAGVNRFSLGVQSFVDEELKTLSRMHNAGEVWQTVEALQRAGVKNYNLDLIYGIPGQTEASWRYSLKKAVDCSPSHISAYLLQLNEEVPMAKAVRRGELRLLPEEKERSLYYLAIDYLNRHGFEQYEISNFCRDRLVCRHNLVYWRAGEYIGLGAGAVSYLNGRRFLNIPSVAGYIKNLQQGLLPAREELEYMATREEKALDAIILGLRLCRGINLAEFKERFGIDIGEKYKNIIRRYEEEKLLAVEDGYMYLTQKGYFLSNQVLIGFIGG
ncbi:oxygen-independent coproporphyrinogen-3 oxidase [Thermosyntropha lipolytica DSM 11003]|uniref:Heme chaperone HemW n=1 Tax=Thermosyntropha lipolytica DSM 11003 TaxID=1123382 RepID=A0A1M5N6S7_9FIRM|nr:radical SAM family heme chaperone HemW [Thermosyntropha lipolytica]SHG85296.1 oxygen-independent coproporphyrinogen-3 oxidase [Thermosyntropha lipolytica DSM 11003]